MFEKKYDQIYDEDVFSILWKAFRFEIIFVSYFFSFNTIIVKHFIGKYRKLCGIQKCINIYLVGDNGSCCKIASSLLLLLFEWVYFKKSVSLLVLYVKYI